MAKIIVLILTQCVRIHASTVSQVVGLTIIFTIDVEIVLRHGLQDLINQKLNKKQVMRHWVIATLTKTYLIIS